MKYLKMNMEWVAFQIWEKGSDSSTSSGTHPVFLGFFICPEHERGFLIVPAWISRETCVRSNLKFFGVRSSVVFNVLQSTSYYSVLEYFTTKYCALFGWERPAWDTTSPLFVQLRKTVAYREDLAAVCDIWSGGAWSGPALPRCASLLPYIPYDENSPAKEIGTVFMYGSRNSNDS
jgi:hypothetical protein